MHPILHRKLTEIVEARRAVRLRWVNAWLLIITAAIIGVAIVVPDAHKHYHQVVLGVAAFLAVGALAIRLFVRPEKIDMQQLARDVEAKNPELGELLITAVEQKPGATGLSYLQERVINSAAKEAVKHLWGDELTVADQKRAAIGLFAGLACLVLTCGGFFWQLFKPVPKPQTVAEVKAKPQAPKPPAAQYEIEVTPGDVEVEKGTRLVVEAKFASDVPAEATLVISDAKGIERQRVPMKLTVDDKVFGTSVANLKEDGVYRVEFEKHKSPDFKITTFILPELVSSDATVTPPAYSGQPSREIKNTQKVTLMEGAKLSYKMKLNKAVKQAELYDDDEHKVELKPTTDPTIVEGSWLPDETRKYRLHLVDDHERSSKKVPVFTITVTKNSLPKIEIAFPKRDAKVSPIQELALEAKVWDDLGVLKAGAVVDVADHKKDIPLDLAKTEPGKKIDVKTALNLEAEDVEPTQLVSYYFWAEDKGPHGETRRTMSDMFFAEVRAFEDIFREVEPPPSEEGEGKPSQTDQLAKLQKDIVNANWRLQRDQAGGKAMPQLKPDVDTVMTSQAIAQQKLDETLEQVKDPKVKAPLLEAKKQMAAAEKTLSQASEKADAKALNDALTPEQSALRYIFQAQNNEHRVTKANPKSSKGQPGEQEQKEELSMLELKQKDQRYEEEKQASEEKTAEQQENLTVLNRLKELARRQEALAEKMKELEQQLAQAKTEDQKEELANQLKRLQDEQDQLLRDLDDLKERMEKPENSANMAEAKKQLEDTREKVNEAAEKMREQKLAQAASAASRAQKDLEKARDDFRERTARRFTEEMKSMREQARELAEAQKKLSEEMENQPGNGKDAFDTTSSLKQRLSGAQASRKIDEQKERATKLMDDMKRVAEQAEASEPLLHKRLYEAVRSANTQGLEENLDEASAQSRYGERNAAQDAERRASKAIDDLKSGVEKAAESVLGNESEALRMARNELDKLIDEAKGEKGKESDSKSVADAKAKGDKSGSKEQGAGSPKELADAKTQGKDGAKANADAKGDKPGDQTGKDGKGQMAQAGDKADGKDGEGKKPGDGKAKGDKSGKGEVASSAKGEGKGDKPGDSESKDGKGETADASKPGQGKGDKPGESQGEGKKVADATKPSQAKGKGQGQGQQPGEGKDGEPGDANAQASASSAKGDRNQPRNGQRNAANADGGGGDWFFDDAKEEANHAPITGANFGAWSDRLRNLEEALDRPELRGEIATVLDRARQYRRDYERHSDAPAVEFLQTRIVKPLVELRDKVTEELARKEGKNPLAPVDRDPVPEAYRELVQKYYEQLGAGK